MRGLVRRPAPARARRAGSRRLAAARDRARQRHRRHRTAGRRHRGGNARPARWRRGHRGAGAGACQRVPAPAVPRDRPPASGGRAGRGTPAVALPPAFPAGAAPRQPGRRGIRRGALAGAGQPTRPGRAGRAEPGDAAHGRGDPEVRPHRPADPGHRGDRHRQGSRRAGAPRPLPPRREGLCAAQLRRNPRQPRAIGAVRARARGVHRGDGAPHRPVRDGGWRHRVPGRDRRPAAGRPDQPAAGPAGRHHRTRGQPPADQGRRTRDRRNPRGPGAGDRGRPLPRRPVLPPQRPAPAHAPPGRPRRGHRPAGPALPRPLP